MLTSTSELGWSSEATEPASSVSIAPPGSDALRILWNIGPDLIRLLEGLGDAAEEYDSPVVVKDIGEEVFRLAGEQVRLSSVFRLGDISGGVRDLLRVSKLDSSFRFCSIIFEW